jgi:hypothetical protein
MPRACQNPPFLPPLRSAGVPQNISRSWRLGVHPRAGGRGRKLSKKWSLATGSSPRGWARHRLEEEGAQIAGQVVIKEKRVKALRGHLAKQEEKLRDARAELSKAESALIGVQNELISLVTAATAREVEASFHRFMQGMKHLEIAIRQYGDSGGAREMLTSYSEYWRLFGSSPMGISAARGPDPRWVEAVNAFVGRIQRGEFENLRLEL